MYPAVSLAHTRALHFDFRSGKNKNRVSTFAEIAVV